MTTNVPLETVIYTGYTHVTGGRNGAGKSSDGALDVLLGFPGSGNPGTNPEQLYGVGYSACFLGAIGIAAQSLKIRLSEETSVDAEVSLGKIAAGDYQLAVKLNINIPGVDDETKRKLVEIAHQTCPYSRATRGDINVELAIA